MASLPSFNSGGDTRVCQASTISTKQKQHDKRSHGDATEWPSACAPGRPLHGYNDPHPSLTAWQLLFHRWGTTRRHAQNSTGFSKISTNYNWLLMSLPVSPFSCSTARVSSDPWDEESLIKDGPFLQNEMSVFNPSRTLLWLEHQRGNMEPGGQNTAEYACGTALHMHISLLL